MKRNRSANDAKKPPAFVARAERAFGRVARKLRAENRKLGLRPGVWANGKRAVPPMKSEMRDKLAQLPFEEHETKRERSGRCH